MTTTTTPAGEQGAMLGRKATAATAAALAAQQTARERAELDAVPVTDADVDADPEVVALEERIAEGDESVTADQLASERTAAAGRVRFRRLRELAADRKARRDADELERRQAAAAIEHARSVIGPYAPAQLVPLYDQAVAAVRAYTEMLAARNAALTTLTRGTPRHERVRDALVDLGDGPAGDNLPLDGHDYRHQQIDQHVERLLAAAGLAPGGGRRFQPVDLSQYGLDQRDPEIVAEGRAQLGVAEGRAQLGDGAA